MSKVMTASEMGKIGGKNRWKGSTKEERRAFAIKGVLARGHKIKDKSKKS